MALPKIATPQYQCIIPSTGQDITYRPFLVKEEKILLMAQESDNPSDQIVAVAKLLADCIETEGIEISKLTTFDLEYLFLKLRSKSVGEVVEVKIRHSNMSGPNGTLEPSCDHSTDVSINLDDIQPPGPIPDTKVQLNDDIGVNLRFPSFQDIANDGTDDQTELVFNLMIDCIEYVYDKEEVYNDFTKEELTEWVENLGQKEFENLSNFFNQLPQLKYTVKWTCPKCNENDEMELAGLNAFFT